MRLLNFAVITGKILHNKDVFFVATLSPKGKSFGLRIHPTQHVPAFYIEKYVGQIAVVAGQILPESRMSDTTCPQISVFFLAPFEGKMRGKLKKASPKDFSGGWLFGVEEEEDKNGKDK